MKRMVSLLVTFLVMGVPAQLYAKAATAKITIKGADLKTPIEITDPKVLERFRVWTGLGTSSNEAKGLIVDWSQGAVVERPKGLQRYEVSFYAKLPDRLLYVVFYEYNPSTEQGYVYLPGKTDQWYQLNMSTIVHGVEESLYHSWNEWDRVARPLIVSAKVAASQ